MSDFRNPIDTLKTWAIKADKKWLGKHILKVIELKRELEEDEIGEIYSDFLRENDLGQEKTRPSDENEKKVITEKKSTVSNTKPIKKMIFESISEVEGVNALSPKQEIKFNANLTVVFGYNATGKSGYVRIFKRISKSRTCEDIWCNIYKRKDRNICTAKFSIIIDDTKSEIKWAGESEVYPLTLVDVFDNKCVKVFLTDDLEFGFKPYGFELFSLISKGVGKIKNEVEAEIEKKSADKDYIQYFKQGTVVYKLICNLNHTTLESDIDALSSLSDQEIKDLDAKEKEVKALSSTNIADRIAVVKVEKKTLESIGETLKSIKECLGHESLKEYKKFAVDYTKAVKKAMSRKVADLKRFNIPSQESKEWMDFIKAADEYIKILTKEEYPKKADKCIYCRQGLSAEAIELIRSYRTLVGSEEEYAVALCEEKINSLVEGLSHKDFSLPILPKDEKEDQISNLLEACEAGLHKKIKDYFTNAENAKNDVVKLLQSKKDISTTFVIDKELISTIDMALKNKTSELTNLEEDVSKKDEKLKKLEEETQELRDRKLLRDKKVEIKAYLNDKKWVKKAEDVNRITTTKPITDLSKRVWENLVTDEFKTIFEKERTRLKAPKIEFVFPGEYGIQKRSKSIEGLKNIDDILSEGEQKAIAIADFLAELTLKSESTPVVFDDPVSSFDHKRRETVAARLVEESKKRQVIIFTHDILFLHYLFEACDDSAYVFYHWIEQENDSSYGKITLFDCPLLNKYSVKLKCVENSIAKAKDLGGSDREREIMSGFSALRAAYENFVIEKIFRKVVQRWVEKMQMLELKKIKYNEELLGKVQDKFEGLSLYIEAHSHSGMSRQDPPDIDKLKTELEYLRSLESSLGSSK